MRDGPAFALLRVAARNPRAVAEALHRDSRQAKLNVGEEQAIIALHLRGEMDARSNQHSCAVHSSSPDLYCRCGVLK